MAIQIRRGHKANLDTSKLVFGEMVVADDEDYVGVAQAPSTMIELASKNHVANAVSGIIDDTSTAANKTWSSQKIAQSGGAVIDDSTTSSSKTWSSQKISQSGGATIDDSTTSSSKTWSSNKISSEITGAGGVSNAYKNVKVDSTTITASGEDTLELKAGTNVTLTPNTRDKSVTIAASGGGSVSYITSAQIQSLFTPTPTPPTVVPFSTATDSQFADIIDAYYSGLLTLADVQAVWSVGNTRSINLSAIAASGGSGSSAWSVGESHRQQTVTIQIIDFVHDTLASDNRKKALITVQLKDCMLDANTTLEDYGNLNTENGYMNSTDTNDSGWESCARRAWCNNGFYNALPSYIKSRVRERMVNTYLPSYGHIRTTTDYVFFPSEIEVFGSRNHSYEGEGTQYYYYSLSTANKYKKPAWDSSHANTSYWWLRSPHASDNERFCAVSYTGTADDNLAHIALGIVPAFCL